MTPEQAYKSLLDVTGALALLVILAMLLERALALIFEYHWFQELSKKYEGLKTPIAFAVSWFTCSFVQFDVLSRLFLPSTVTPEPKAIGILITSAIVAGGSAGAIMLFQGVLNFSREARTSLIEAKKVNAEADLAEAKARKDKAESETAQSIAKKEKAEAEAIVAKNTLYSLGSPIDEEIDSCCIGRVEHTTSDEDLPAAEGGVALL
jgi:hypothetical protein